MITASFGLSLSPPRFHQTVCMQYKLGEYNFPELIRSQNAWSQFSELRKNLTHPGRHSPEGAFNAETLHIIHIFEIQLHDAGTQPELKLKWASWWKKIRLNENGHRMKKSNSFSWHSGWLMWHFNLSTVQRVLGSNPNKDVIIIFPHLALKKLTLENSGWSSGDEAP